MQIPAAGPGYAAPAAKASDPATAVDRAFADMLHGADDPEQVLHDITKDGMRSLMAWKIQQLEAELLAKKMRERGLTEEKLAAMSADDRLAAKKSLMDEVARIVKQMMEEQARQEQVKALTKNTGIDILA